MISSPMRAIIFGAALAIGATAFAAETPFVVTVVDEATGRGVPLVELRTVNDVSFFTDSAGVLAIDDPELLGRKVFFTVRSHGYEFPPDGFGFRGKALELTAGGTAKLAIKRVNLAERLYRVTGGGIYRDSVRAGMKPPIKEPLLNAQVFGSDSVVNAVYGGKLRWFWGDTNRPSYPLGNFNVPGATSELPQNGGLDPEKGIDLSYFVDDAGFAKPTCKMPGKGPTWITGLSVVSDSSGRETMLAGYMKVEAPLKVYERGLVRWNDERNEFEHVAMFPLDAPALPDGHTFVYEEGGKKYVYFCTPLPLVRVAATAEAMADVNVYEAFTCLTAGSRMDKPAVERGDDGSVRYGWKRNAPPVGVKEQDQLIKAGHLKPHEAWHFLRDRATGKRVSAHAGSVYWNEFRRRWVMIAVEYFGTSALGEVWYAESDTPLGPWCYAAKIVTHERYSFYNPKQHPYFDKDGGRRILFEGTYAQTFSGAPVATPRYDYNQMMYKLDLEDRRLALPAPVYGFDDGGAMRFATRQAAGARQPWQGVVFFALDRPGAGTVPIHEERSAGEPPRLVAGKEGDGRRKEPVFYALPADTKSPLDATVGLFECVSDDGKRRVCVTGDTPAPQGLTRAESPVCLVWRNPKSPASQAAK
ncbi:MAG: hypothetical protein HYS13_07340 [Planctomycetia bacterium]|nr:hypothetical protein [Planctomycetia bacterium]